MNSLRSASAALLLFLAMSPAAYASTAYGSINNFDTVNDTGSRCHGFEIELEDIHSRDITYTYDFNHYGVPKIREDNTDPLHPKVFVRYESAKNSDGSWAAFTAVPAAPISPTDGHQFINPSVNFGGEHFGVGFYGTPTAVKYNWLKDDGSGQLVYAGEVYISTPTFTYVPPERRKLGHVDADIVQPRPHEAPQREFGVATWVKVTKTSSHNNRKVKLRDLVSDDPNDSHDTNWRNGEPAEVETEWKLLQTDFSRNNGGKHGKLAGRPEELPHGDEVITRRYDFYKYVGPVDPETGEAIAESVGADGIHGSGTENMDGVEVDLSTVVVVGDYLGAQMAGFDAAGQIGLIDHLQDGEINVPYVERSLVIGGTAPISTTLTGALPEGMRFDTVTGILSGTPTVSGTFTLTVHSTDAHGGNVTTTFTLKVALRSRVSGTLLLEGVSPTALAQPFTFLFRTPGQPDSQLTELVPPTGAYSLLVPGSDGVLHISGAKYLAKRVSVSASTGDISGLTIALKAGDANNDNTVDVVDLLLIIAHYNQVSPATGYLDAADFNSDGANDVSDLLLVIANYNRIGD